MDARLLTQRLVLELPRMEDGLALLKFRTANRFHLRPWEPLRQTSYFSKEAVKDYLAESIKRIDCGDSLYWHLKLVDSPNILGTCSFTNIVHGAFKACHLGFSLDGEHQGKGFMFEALETAIEDIFERFKLHRIMANYQPSNLKSEMLLLKLGFEKEGYARSYLKLDGEWKDHVLTSLVAFY